MRAYLAVGTSVDDQTSTLDFVRHQLGNMGIHLLATSSVAETGQVGGAPEPRFLNQVLEIETDYQPSGLLGVLERIEAVAAARPLVNAGDPTPVDLCLLLYGQLRINSSDLALPHPDLISRDFLLKGLTEVNAK